MKVIDLFCGCGGMGLGFQQAGFEIVYACDIDKYAIQSYRHNIGEHGVVADITKLTATDLPKADVWTFGFPCQDLSVAGKKAGMEVGTRSGLFYEVMRLLDEVNEKPKVIMAENVKGLKPYLSILEQEFNKRGYQMTIKLYNSKYWGVPQSRERYYVIGYLNGEVVMPAQINEYVSKLSDCIEDNVSEKYFMKDNKSKEIISHALELDDNPQNVFTDKDGAAYCCTARYYKGIAPSSVGKSKDTHIVLHNIYGGFKEDKARVFTDCFPTIRTAAGGGHIPSVLKMEPPYHVRRLTPRECARLQGFPDSYEIVVSDTQAYKQFGNSVTVPLVKAIAESIKAVLVDEQSTTEG